MSRSTHYDGSLQGRVFPANHLVMVLTKQTYNTHDKHKKTKFKLKKAQNVNKLNETNPGLVASYHIWPGNETDLF